MSVNVEFTAEQQRQWKIWTEAKNHGWTDEDIARLLNRTTRTITRLKNKARANGAYREWLEGTLDWAEEEFRELHKLIKATTPNQAYAQMGRIIERSLTQHNIMEVTDTTPVVNVYKWNPDEDADPS